MPELIRSVYDRLLAGGGVGSVGNNGGATDPGYSILPMQFVNTPNSGGQHLGSAYDGGYEGYLVKTLAQLRGQKPAAPFGTVVTGTWCTSGPASCRASIDAALARTYDALRTANGGSTDVASWTSSTVSHAAGQTMPQFDAIAYRALGVIGQPNIDWQNRPTFQQVVQFPRHRPR